VIFAAAQFCARAFAVVCCGVAFDCAGLIVEMIDVVHRHSGEPAPKRKLV
jgi:hypothetical protein